jgi:hypothetical protein
MGDAQLPLPAELLFAAHAAEAIAERDARASDPRNFRHFNNIVHVQHHAYGNEKRDDGTWGMSEDFYIPVDFCIEDYGDGDGTSPTTIWKFASHCFGTAGGKHGISLSARTIRIIRECTGAVFVSIKNLSL